MKFLFIMFSIFLFLSCHLFSNDLKIIDQTKSKIICKNENVELWIDADGKNLEYQWFFNNKSIPDANKRIYTIYNFDFSNSGTYYCLVKKTSEPLVELRSDDINVYIATETIFTKKPDNVMFKQGNTAMFVGKIHMNQENGKIATLQWYFLEGEDIQRKDRLKILNDNNKYSGTKSEILTVKDINYFDKGIYICVANGKCGNDTTFAYLNDNIYFKLKNLSKGFFNCSGGDAVLEVEVTNFIGGELEYQWYNPGFKIIKESNKFVGTKTKKLTIKNVQMTDNNAYYLKVTHKLSGHFARSEHFYVEPDMAPIISMQPKDYLIKDREASPTQAGQTYVAVVVDNAKPCTFKWYRNDTLVRTTYGLKTSDYFLGPQFSPRPAKMTDVGVYQCEIINECGTTWTKKARVIWGLDDATFCAGEDAILVADNESKDTNQYKYFWFFNNQLINESSKYLNTTSNKLIVKNIKENDKGSYHAYLQAINGGLTHYLGKAYLNVNQVPIITKQLPDTLYLDGRWLKKATLVVKATAPVLYHQYFNSKNEPISDITKKSITNIYEEYQIFSHGGSDNTLKDGTYYIKFWNDCGETQTKLFTISNTEKPFGILLDSALISSKNDYTSKKEIQIFPNPASDYILINYNLVGNKIFMEDGDINTIELFNVLGNKILKFKVENSAIIKQEQLIDISELPKGIYFVKFGNKLERFVKM